MGKLKLKFGNFVHRYRPQDILLEQMFELIDLWAVVHAPAGKPAQVIKENLSHDDAIRERNRLLAERL